MNRRESGSGPGRWRRPRWLVPALVLCLASIVAGVVTTTDVWSLFSSTTSNPSNSFSAGTVTLSDNDIGVRMFNRSAMKPGDTASACLQVTYNGSVPSTVVLYGTSSGTGLDAYLDLKVTRGLYVPTSPAFPSCTNFQADTSDYIGAGPGVVYAGTLQAYPPSFDSGLVDPKPGSPETWTTDEIHVYRFDVTVLDDNNAQGKNTTHTVTFEARNQ